jgi:hypothetical protein
MFLGLSIQVLGGWFRDAPYLVGSVKQPVLNPAAQRDARLMQFLGAAHTTPASGVSPGV